MCNHSVQSGLLYYFSRDTFLVQMINRKELLNLKEKETVLTIQTFKKSNIKTKINQEN